MNCAYCEKPATRRVIFDHGPEHVEKLLKENEDRTKWFEQIEAPNE